MGIAFGPHHAKNARQIASIKRSARRQKAFSKTLKVKPKKAMKSNPKKKANTMKAMKVKAMEEMKANLEKAMKMKAMKVKTLKVKPMKANPKKKANPEVAIKVLKVKPMQGQPEEGHDIGPEKEGEHDEHYAAGERRREFGARQREVGLRGHAERQKRLGGGVVW